MAHLDHRALDARLEDPREGRAIGARRPGANRRRRGGQGQWFLAVALALLITLLRGGAQAIDCTATACKPGYANVGDVDVATTCNNCADGSCYTGCGECCAKAGYSCADALCAPGHSKKSGFVPQCTRCASAGEDTCSNTAASVGCQECCEALSCSQTTVCAFGYVNTGESPSPALGGCGDGTPCRAGGAAACCAPAKSVFPTCETSVPPAGKQALATNDASWAFRSTGSGFTRFKGKLTGMCFSINLRNDCSAGDASLASSCCTQRNPTFFQVKLAHPDALTGITGAESRLATLKLLDRCRLSYGLATATINGIKRFPRVVDVAATEAAPGNKASRVYNLPLSLSSSAQSVEFCLFTNSAQSVDPETNNTVNCSWENICGLLPGDLSVPSPSDPSDKDRSLGCQFRLIGRADTRVSAPCCTAPMTLTTYDGTHESSAASVPTGRRRLFFV